MEITWNIPPTRMRLGTGSPDVLPNTRNHFPQGILSQGSKETKEVHLRKGTVRSALPSLLQIFNYHQTGYVPRQTSARLLFPPILSVHHPSRHLGILLNPETGRQGAVHDPQTNLAVALDHELGMARGTPSRTDRTMVDSQREKQANASSNDFGTVGSSSCGFSPYPEGHPARHLHGRSRRSKRTFFSDLGRRGPGSWRNQYAADLRKEMSRSGRNSCRYLHNGNARTETALTSFPGRGNPSARLVRPGKQRFARRVSALLDHMTYAMPMPPMPSVPEPISKPVRKSWAMNRQE